MEIIKYGFGKCLIEVLRTNLTLQDLHGELSTYNERKLDIHYKSLRQINTSNQLLSTVTTNNVLH